METINKLVAVEPFKKETAADKPKARGVDLTDLTVTKLIETKVMFKSEKYSVGDTLFFRSDVLRIPMATQKLQMGEQTFILMPEDLPVFVQKAPAQPVPRPAPLPPSGPGVQSTGPL